MSKENTILLSVADLKMHFPLMKGTIVRRQVGAVKAVDGVDFNIASGETLGLVGESGCGKSTVGRAILQLYRPTSGKVLFAGHDLCTLGDHELRRMRRQMQMIFQDPYASLNPRMTAQGIVGEPFEIHGLLAGSERRERVEELLRIVGLNPYFSDRYPHEFSSGQRQRIGIARALAVEPRFIVCDEPISSLDVSIQAQIINLLDELQASFGLTYLFISHDLSVVRYISNRVAVMYVGKIVELADRDEIYRAPLHPYTRALMSAIPIPDPEAEAHRQQIILSGEVPSAVHPPEGCRFHTRCPIVMAICRETEPRFRDAGAGHWVACHAVQQ